MACLGVFRFVCGFCEWKAWCPKWFVAVHDETLKRHKTFNDEVVTLINFDSEEGLASFKLMIPDGLDGELRDSEKSFGAFLSKSFAPRGDFQKCGGRATKTKKN